MFLRPLLEEEKNSKIKPKCRDCEKGANQADLFVASERMRKEWISCRKCADLCLKGKFGAVRRGEMKYSMESLLPQTT
ncbi:hypothetical protein GWM83_02510 [Candidatus Bathyarchaeota archaeon]|nr:hypothetical protein [Desulfobacterales bacterium]NIW34418.1 hypothetical protein [Candidatus Bathyarchaeota archaeon]